MTPLEIGATVATALLSSHSAYYLPKTYAKLKLIAQGLHMDSNQLDELFAAVKNAQSLKDNDINAKAAAIAKADQSTQAYKTARTAFLDAATAAFPDVTP